MATQNNAAHIILVEINSVWILVKMMVLPL